jgi:predicted DCC family thiol-disulfide oxidoreductase YuxK
MTFANASSTPGQVSDQRLPVSDPISVPVLVFDGDCGFCTTCARFLRRWVVDGHSALVEPWQRLDLDALGLTASQCQQAVQWVDDNLDVASGHAAIAAAIRAGHLVWRPFGTLLVAPGFSWLAARIYAWVASHRYALPGGTPACRID